MAEYPEKMPWAIETISLVTAVGGGLQGAPRLLASLLESLQDIEILGIALGAGNCSLTVALARDDARGAVERIHGVIVRSDSDSA